MFQKMIKIVLFAVVFLLQTLYVLLQLPYHSAICCRKLIESGLYIAFCRSTYHITNCNEFISVQSLHLKLLRHMNWRIAGEMN